MNITSDLKAIEQATTRIRNTRSKLLGQAINIRKAADMVDNFKPGTQRQIVAILEDAAALIEHELHKGSRDD